MGKRLYGLKRIVNSKTKILLLGSFPSKESLLSKEYYANKRNQFWPIMLDLLQKRNAPINYKSKKKLLRVKKIGLWDVVGSCHRKGSSDKEIRDTKLNDIKRSLRKYPNIEAIFLNGRKAERLFRQNGLNSVHIEYLPSTSPANPQKYRYKRAKWKKILQHV